MRITIILYKFLILVIMQACKDEPIPIAISLIAIRAVTLSLSRTVL